MLPLNKLRMPAVFQLLSRPVSRTRNYLGKHSRYFCYFSFPDKIEEVAE